MAFKDALGAPEGIKKFGAVVDISRRPFADINLELKREKLEIYQLRCCQNL
nr:7231_t:CDS:2 [Entrophospora candida]